MIYSGEFIQLNMEYARKYQERSNSDLLEVLTRLTCLPRTVLGIDFKKGISGPLWDEFVASLNTDPVTKAFELQKKRPAGHTENRIRSGRISATYPDTENISLIHFSADNADLHPFDKEGIAGRKREFKEVITELSKFSPAMIGMFSWLLDTRFREFFPAETEYIPNPNAYYASLAVWGQYLRHDGSLNQGRASQLLNTLSHPLIAYQARVKASEMLTYCLK